LRNNRISAALAIAVVLAIGAAGIFARDDKDKGNSGYKSDTLLLSRSVYEGTASSVTIGQTLPPGCVAQTVTLPVIGGGTTTVKVKCTTATDNGEYPNLNDSHNVFNNNSADGSFGVTSPIFLDNITTDGNVLHTLAVPTNILVTSFSSKSELALNLSTDGRSITFVGYAGGGQSVTGPNQLDVSNSNTPGVVDPTNPVVSTYYRAVMEVDGDGHMTLTNGNGYSGNNGRAAIKAHSLYYMAGNDNNGGLSATQLNTTQVGVNLVNSTGVELLVPGMTPPIPPNINKIGEFAVTQVGFANPDKPGKDNNFRGLTIHNDTLYVTKGSGGNGINTVYQVGNSGELPTLSNEPGIPPSLKNVPITILPGFPNTLASGVAQDGSAGHPVAFPFGIWFANDHTLYVCDEGDGVSVPSRLINGQPNVADASELATAGIQKWTLKNGKWTMLYVLQNGLNIGVPYSVANYPTALNPATGGCRNITGRHDDDGTVTIYAVTSTISANADQGADPNKLVRVRDRINATTLPTADGDHDKDDHLGVIVTIRSAKAGEVLRGVAFVPKDHDNDDRDGKGDKDHE
jgi:hypothetical protein